MVKQEMGSQQVEVEGISREAGGTTVRPRFRGPGCLSKVRPLVPSRFAFEPLKKKAYRVWLLWDPTDDLH